MGYQQNSTILFLTTLLTLPEILTLACVAFIKNSQVGAKGTTYLDFTHYILTACIFLFRQFHRNSARKERGKGAPSTSNLSVFETSTSPILSSIMIKLFCIVFVILALQDFQQVNAVRRGWECRPNPYDWSESNCDDGLFCCSPDGSAWKNGRCQECCNDSNCFSNEECKYVDT